MATPTGKGNMPESDLRLREYRGFPKLGDTFSGGGVPYNKDDNILGVYIGVPYSGILPYGLRSTGCHVGGLRMTTLSGMGGPLSE